MKPLLIFLMLATTLACRGGPLAGTSFENENEFHDHFTGADCVVQEGLAHFGSKSLKWSFMPEAVLTVSNIRSLSPEASGAKYGSHFPLSPTFVMSVYSKHPKEKPLRVEFNGDTYFMMSLDFTGWRTLWVPFHEMQGGAPAAGEPYAVESMRFVAPDNAVGNLYFDDIVFSQYVDNRHPYPDSIVPFIKEGGAHAWDHWMPKLPHWKLLENLETPALSTTDQAELQKVEERLHTEYFEASLRLRGVEYFRRKFESEGVLPESGSPLPLKMVHQVSPVRYEPALGEEPEYADMRSFGRLMLRLANEVLSTADEGVRTELSALFAEASKYYLDQGWGAGSSVGTLHHFGYQTRELHTAFFLMRDALHEQGLLGAIGESVRWQLNFGEVLDPEHLESNLDYYNTQSAFRLMSAFMVNNPEKQSALLQAYSAHLTAALALTNSQGFRPDGTAWHHWGHYPAYAIGAFSRVPISLEVLSGTRYRIGEAGHANFRRAFLAATLYSNPTYYGLGLAGRHPLGGNIGSLKDACLALALSGTPDGRADIDIEVANAYVRLWGMPEEDAFSKVAIDATPPSGHWTFPYAALSVHRRSDWSVNIKGFNTFVWASEIYNTDNRYGRYQSSGVVQILPGLPQKETGYSEAGWDWNHPPGATTIPRPFAELEPKRSLVMFKSDETYAGGTSLEGDGVWAMKLNEADGYTIDPVKEKMSFPGNLKARKSVFCFGDQLLCLGSGIESDDPSAPVHTTLFQNGIRPKDEEIYSNGEGLLMDPIGNAYRMHSDSKVVVTVGRQSSPNNKHSLWTGKGRGKPSESGRFAKAWIDHGPAPKNGTYAYAVYPQLGAADFDSLKAKVDLFPELAIRRQDNAAHIVEEPAGRTTAYACFEAGEVGVGSLESVSVPCYVMIRAGDMLMVSVANPDLNQEEDPVKGHFNGDSREAPVTLRLKGRWKVKGAAQAWTVADGDSTLLTVKCRDGAPVMVELEMSNDRELFEQAVKLNWKPVFDGGRSMDWKLDGEFATVTDMVGGFEFSAGPEEWNHAHHAVLWTEDSFEGDIKIEYDYTRLDAVNQWVNILYIQATGKGGEFPEDIMEWADRRREPWMRNYFETMKLLHVSYAAYGRDDLGEDDDYVRCRRYPKAEDGEFSRTEIKPDSFRTGLFRTGETYRITAIKQGDRLFFHVSGSDRESLFAWQSPLIDEVEQGRVGLRHMWMKAARYADFSVSVLEK